MHDTLNKSETTNGKFLLLIKFGKKKHIQALRKTGEIYFNQIDYFKRLADYKIRGDSNENITHLFQPDKIKMYVNDHLLNLAGPVKLYNPPDDKFGATHLYCMSCLHDQMEVRPDHNIFDDRVNGFGDMMLLITDSKEFIKRLDKALDSYFDSSTINRSASGLIKYIDEGDYHGKADVFTKTKNYDWQNEFRFTISSPGTVTPFILELGNIEDISLELDMKDFKNKVLVHKDKTVTLSFS